MPQEGNASGLLLIVGSSFGDLDDWAAALFPLYVLSATCFFFFFLSLCTEGWILFFQKCS